MSVESEVTWTYCGALGQPSRGRRQQPVNFPCAESAAVVGGKLFADVFYFGRVKCGVGSLSVGDDIGDSVSDSFLCVAAPGTLKASSRDSLIPGGGGSNFRRCPMRKKYTDYCVLVHRPFVARPHYFPYMEWLRNNRPPLLSHTRSAHLRVPLGITA